MQFEGLFGLVVQGSRFVLVADSVRWDPVRLSEFKRWHCCPAL